MLARLSALPATGTCAGPRRSLSDGVAAESETASERIPGAGLREPWGLGLCEGRRDQKLDGSSMTDRPPHSNLREYSRDRGTI